LKHQQTGLLHVLQRLVEMTAHSGYFLSLKLKEMRKDWVLPKTRFWVTNG